MDSMSNEEFQRVCAEIDDLLCIHLKELLQQKMPNENHFGATLYILTRLVTKVVYRASSDEAEQVEKLNTFANGVKKMLSGIEKTSSH